MTLELREERWYKHYRAENLFYLAGEILTTKLPFHRGLVSNRLEKLEFGNNFVEIEVSTQDYPLPIGTVNKEDIICLVEGLAFLESKNLVHGDIQVKNIVRTEYGLSLIDFTVVVSCRDCLSITQGHKDRIGIDHYNDIIKIVNPLRQAIYALGVVIGQLTKEFSGIADLLKSEDRPKSFFDVLQLFDTISLYEREEIIDYDPIMFENVKDFRSIYDSVLNNEISLYHLYLYLVVGKVAYGIIDREKIEDSTWIHKIPSYSGKYLTLGFASLYSTGKWIPRDICGVNDTWSGDIFDELKDFNMERIKVLTENIEFVIETN